MRVAVVFNPISGRSGTEAYVTELAGVLKRRGVAVEALATTGPGDATRLASGIGADVDAVLAVGGDGTVREVAAGLVGRPGSVPVVVVPRGTENVVARELGMTDRPDCVADAVLGGQARAFDVGRLDGRVFLFVVGVGFDGAVATAMARGRKGHISHVSYAGPLWRTVRTYRFPELTVTVDGEEVFEGAGQVFVGVMSRYAMGLRICRRAVWDDGLLDVCVLPCRGLAGLVIQGLRVAVGRHVQAESVVYRTGRTVAIRSSEAVAVQMDGEAAGVLPIACEIEHKALRLMVPPVG